MKAECTHCGRTYKARPCRLKAGRKFCSKPCANEAQKTGKYVSCHICSKDVWRTPGELEKAKTQTYFCGATCRSAWTEKEMPSGEKHPRWKGAEKSYRQRALKAYGKQCSNENCVIKAAGIDVPSKMLDVDHTDENRKNNKLENLQVLCVWCHATKTRKHWK